MTGHLSLIKRAGLAAGALALLGATAQAAERPEILADEQQITAEILALDTEHNLMILQAPDGETSRVIHIPEGVYDLDLARVDDEVRVDYLEALLLEAEPADEMRESIAYSETEARVAEGALDEDTMVQMVSMDVRLLAYDSTHHLALIEGPDGNQREVAVKDPALQQALANFDAEDFVTVGFTEARAIQVDDTTTGG